jgi:hypothetical protein
VASFRLLPPDKSQGRKMSDRSGEHRPRPARLGWVGALLALLGIVALTACSSSNSSGSATGTSTSGVSTAYTQALSYAQCMRTHGVPNYPDPNSKGQFYIANGASDPTVNVSEAVLNAAAQACQKLLPATMVKPPNGQGSTSDQTAQLGWAACMRSHGEPNFPDPASDGSFTLPPGMNTESRQFQAASKACPRPAP